LVGALYYHIAETLKEPKELLVCFPEPKPTRNEAIATYVAWTLEHPQFMLEMPVETGFRLLTEKWPCKNSNKGGCNMKKIAILMWTILLMSI
jgi:hypothetical protein